MPARGRQAARPEALQVADPGLLGPLALQVGRGVGGGALAHVEVHDPALAVAADHGLGRVAQGEAGRGGEAEAEVRVLEGAAADEALGRVVAVDHAVDRGEEALLVLLARPRRVRGRDLGGAGQPVGRARVAAQPAGRALLAAGEPASRARRWRASWPRKLAMARGS